MGEGVHLNFIDCLITQANGSKWVSTGVTQANLKVCTFVYHCNMLLSLILTGPTSSHTL